MSGGIRRVRGVMLTTSAAVHDHVNVLVLAAAACCGFIEPCYELG